MLIEANIFYEAPDDFPRSLSSEVKSKVTMFMIPVSYHVHSRGHPYINLKCSV
jgi:hypothetical protein